MILYALLGRIGTAMKKKFEWKLKLCILPAAAGILLFYLLPFLKVIYYSFIKGQYQKSFVGFANYADVLKNTYFQMACRNTLQMIACCVPVFLAAAVLLSILYCGSGTVGHFLRKLTILPLLLPSVSVVAAFVLLFEGMDSPLPVYILFLWKYLGMGIVIVSSALTAVEPQLYEAARMDGAGFWALHGRITLPLCARPIGFTAVLGVVYCFRTFRESYLYYGSNYPPDYSYTLQYYMNNQFLKLNYQSMAVSSILITLVLAVFIVLCMGKKKETC